MAEQDDAVMLRFSTTGSARNYTSQQAALQLVGGVTGVLGRITDAEAKSDEWSKDNMEAAYEQ